MSKLIFKLKMLYSVIIGEAIVINDSNGEILVDANRYNKHEVQRIATIFFRQAYNL